MFHKFLCIPQGIQSFKFARKGPNSLGNKKVIWFSKCIKCIWPEINLCLVYFMENTLGVRKDVNLYGFSSKPYILGIVKPLYRNQYHILISRLNSRILYSMETFLGEKNHASKCILSLSICLKILSSQGFQVLQPQHFSQISKILGPPLFYFELVGSFLDYSLLIFGYGF